MNLPKTIRLTDGGAYLDGGTINLIAVCDQGETVEIHLNQHLLDGVPPGRLCFNRVLVNVRSDCELSLLRLLETAEISVERGAGPDTDANYIGPPIKTILAEHESKIDCIDELRNLIIDFVRSKRYIEIDDQGH